MEDDEPQHEPQEIEERITKPKRTRTITPEQKQILSERMKKVNEDRIAKAKLANETILAEKEAKARAKLETIQKKKEQVREIKEKKQPETAPAAPKEKKEKKAKKIIIQESSDSEDYGEETETEVVYMTKKKQPAALTKPKTQRAPSAPATQAEPRCVFKFV